MALGHETLERFSVSVGAVCGFQVIPSVVCLIPSPPTAVHSSIVKHEIDSAGKEASSRLQDEPPSVDLMIPDPPPA